MTEKATREELITIVEHAHAALSHMAIKAKSRLDRQVFAARRDRAWQALCAERGDVPPEEEDKTYRPGTLLSIFTAFSEGENIRQLQNKLAAAQRAFEANPTPSLGATIQMAENAIVYHRRLIDKLDRVDA